MNTCDVCGASENIKPGRWIFYCPEHEEKDWEQTYQNEVKPDLESGNLAYLTSDPELQEAVLKHMV